MVLASNTFPPSKLNKNHSNPSKSHGLDFPKNQHHADLGESIMQTTPLSSNIDEAYEINPCYIFECPANRFPHIPPPGLEPGSLG